MMNLANKIGRQEVIAAYVPFDIDDFKDSAGTVQTTALKAISLPQGACVVDGFVAVDTAFTGTTPTLAVGDDDGTPDDDRYLAATSVASTGKTAITNAAAYETTGGCMVTLKLSAADADAGAGRICVNYVVKGRTAFCQE